MLSETREEESWLRTAVKGFAKAVVFTGDRRQNGAGGCDAGATVLQGRESGEEMEQGIGWRSSGREWAFRAISACSG